MTAELLDLLIDKAPALREAGVLQLQIGECIVHLAPKLPDVPRRGRGSGRDSDPDALHDEVTFGRRIRGFPVPGELEAWVEQG